MCVQNNSYSQNNFHFLENQNHNNEQGSQESAAVHAKYYLDMYGLAANLESQYIMLHSWLCFGRFFVCLLVSNVLNKNSLF